MYSKKYPKLFEKGKIGNVEIRNRIVMTPMGTAHVGPDGRMTQEMIDFYAERAKGGVGMIITEATYVSALDPFPLSFGAARLDVPMKIARQAQLVDMIKYYGAVPCVQLSIGMGRQADAPSLAQPVAPSASPSENDPSIMCKELSKDEIKQMIGEMGNAAQLAVACGYPVIEIHGHAGYLIDQFMSPDVNKRTDEYGGSLEGRMRLVKELREEIRNRVGDSLAVIFRLSADQKYPGFRTIEEGVEICKMLEDYGYDALDIDTGRYEAIDWIFPPSYLGKACMADVAHAVKASVSIPVINTGNYNMPDVAEAALENDDTDFISMGRSLLAEPEWANKARLEKEDEIRPCLRCNEFCIMNVLAGKEMTCAVNPACGREERFKLQKAETPKRVTVIGGGPGGMETAIIAAKRGHKVTLLEKADVLGGQLNLAEAEVFKWNIADFNKYMQKQLELNGVDVRLGTAADVESVKATEPDAVVVATGAEVFVPRFLSCDDIMTVADLKKAEFNGKENVVIIGGGLVGSETALGLAMEGHNVSIIEMRDDIAIDLNMINRFSLLGQLAKYNVSINTGITCKEIKDGKVIGTDKDGNTVEFSYDKVVAATGTRQVNNLNEEMEKEFPETYIVGDCLKISKIGNAVHKGFIVATQI